MCKTVGLGNRRYATILRAGGDEAYIKAYAFKAQIIMTSPESVNRLFHDLANYKSGVVGPDV